MTTIHFVRHGETIWHRDERYAGSSDIPLTPLGVEQAQALVPWALATPIDLVVCSDLQRARLTAEPTAHALGLEAVVDPRWRELDFASAEGLSHEELQLRHSLEFAAFAAHPGHEGLLDGETGAAGVERAVLALRSVCDKVGDGTALVVAHSTLGRLLLCHLLGIDLDAYRSVFPFMLNGAVTTFAVSEPERQASAQLLGFNVPV